MRTVLPFLLALLWLPAHCHAKTIFVNKNATGDVHDGASWATAFLIIQHGVNAAAAGDEVWVAASTPAEPAYGENLEIKKELAVYGGFAGIETEREQRDWKTHPTVLDGGTGCCDTIKCQAPNVVLDGLTLLNGRNGVNVSSGSAAIRRCFISGPTYWGPVVAPTGSATMTSCVVQNCARCGVDVSGGSLTLVGTTMYNNGNHGLHAFSNAKVRASNNLVAFNRGYGVTVSASTFEVYAHNDVFGNSFGAYSGYAAPADQGNLTLDPLFVDRAGGDLRPGAGSPCIDAGDDAVVTAGETDLDGQPRLQGAHVDIGAYERVPPGPPPFTLADLTKCLSLACGTEACSPEDLSRLNLEADNPCLDACDAACIARKVAGLEPNP